MIHVQQRQAASGAFVDGCVYTFHHLRVSHDRFLVFFNQLLIRFDFLLRHVTQRSFGRMDSIRFHTDEIDNHFQLASPLYKAECHK